MNVICGIEQVSSALAGRHHYMGQVSQGVGLG